MGTTRDTYVNWETGKTEPVAAQFRPVVEFLGYNPTPTPTNLAERLEAKRRALGITFEQAAKYLGWDPATLARYLNGTWRMPPSRSAILEVFLSARPEDLADGLKAIRLGRNSRSECPCGLVLPTISESASAPSLGTGREPKSPRNAAHQPHLETH